VKAERPKPDTYICIRCLIPPELEEQLPELLVPWSVLGTEIHGGSEDGILVTVYLPEDDADGAKAVSRALASHGAQDIEQVLLEAEDWLAGFREGVRSFEVGELWWIDPHPDRPTAAPAGRRRLVVEPRMAFGTGSHESTQAILMTLESLEVCDRRVLDVGTGSGILALAAESLGAEWVVGLDIDPAAVWVALEISRQQEWRSHTSFVLGSIDCLCGAEFDIVVCNMIASNFLPLLGAVRRALAPTGVAVFSGLLATEAEGVSTALVKTGFEVASRRVDGDWASLTAVAAPAP
jgi:ribosomal protein L11 methyltransferase